jgi:hypothetical protein
MRNIAALEIASVDWSAYDECYGPATKIGDALQDLLASNDVNSGALAWDRIEEHVFSQGDIYSVAEPTVSVVLAALSEEPPWAVGRLLDLLLYIVQGASLTDSTLQGKVRTRAREGLWLLVGIALRSDGWVRDCVLDVIQVIAPERMDLIGAAIEAN